MKAPRKKKSAAVKKVKEGEKKGMVVSPRNSSRRVSLTEKMKEFQAEKASKAAISVARRKKLEAQKKKKTLKIKSRDQKTTKTKGQMKNGKNSRVSATTQKLTKKALKKHESRNDERVTIRPVNRGDSWDGNSDANGSVNSGILEENICFLCGKSTSDKDSDFIVICDICGGDYHFSCVGLDIAPRLSYKCPDCISEYEWNKRECDMHIAKFDLPKRRKGKPEICYSPSRPLALAWKECLDKGFMLVQKVFPFHIIDKLIHGGLLKVTNYGRVAENWTGAVAVLNDRINMGKHNNVINRDGRYDIKIPPFVVEDLNLEKLLEPITAKLKSIMSPHRKPQLRTHNIIFAPVGSSPQQWHYDDSKTIGKYHSYFTILIHLNSIDDLCGGTEVWCKDVKRGDLIRGRPGDAFVFHGSLLHRGQGNRGFTHRWFYYASYSCARDANEVRF